MGRIRTSKPEWWTSAKWCRLPRDIRSTYKGVWEVMCDDEGRFLADPRQVKADVWPLDDDITPKKLAGWLPMLAGVTVTLKDGTRLPAVVFYQADGVRYGFLPGFVKHQKISHPTPSKLPKPPSIERNDSGAAPELSGEIPESSREPQEKLRPDEERDVDFDLERDEEGISPPLIVLPPEATAFLAQFYEPAMNDRQRERYRNVKQQLYEVLDPKHPGPKIRGGIRVKARSVEHLADTLKLVMADPPPDRDLAIVWLLKKLTNPPTGPSVTEVRKRSEEAERQVEDQYFAAAKTAGVRWAKEHPTEYEPIIKTVEATYRDKTGMIADMAKAAELTQRCAREAGFPAFEEWRENRSQLEESVA